MLCSYGHNKAKFERTSDIELVIKPLYEDGMKPNQKVMCEVLRKRGRCIDAMIEEMFKAISKQHNLNLNDDNVNMGGVSNWIKQECIITLNFVLR